MSPVCTAGQGAVTCSLSMGVALALVVLGLALVLFGVGGFLRLSGHRLPSIRRRGRNV